MTIIVGILIGVGACYWIRISSQTKQELIQKQAQFEIMVMLANQNLKDQQGGTK